MGLFDLWQERGYAAAGRGPENELDVPVRRQRNLLPAVIDFVQATRRMLGPAGPPLRDMVAAGAARIGLTKPSRRARRRLTVVTFHRVLPKKERCLYPFPGLVVTPEELCWYMEYFTSRYECGPLTEMVRRWIAGGRNRMPLLAVTFDDGQRDNYVNARPILRRFGVRGSFYVPAKHIEEATPIWHDRLGFATVRVLAQSGGAEKLRELFCLRDQLSKRQLVSHVVNAAKALDPKEREAHIKATEQYAGGKKIPGWAAMMNWGELQTLTNEGHEIGSHSMTHPILNQCEKDEIEREVAGSRFAIERRLGVEVTSFCYPNGSYDERVLSVVRQAGYRSAVTTRFGTNARGGSLHTLRRCDMHPEHARSRFGELFHARLALRLSGLQPGLPT